MHQFIFDDFRAENWSIVKAFVNERESQNEAFLQVEERVDQNKV